MVRTTEYWYLRWWGTIEGKYRYPYRETNRQADILTQRGDAWLVRRTFARHRDRVRRIVKNDAFRMVSVILTSADHV